MMQRFRMLLIALLLVAVPSAGHAGAWLLAPGEWSTQANASYYKADTYYDNDGNRGQIPFGGIVERRTGLSLSEFGWHPKLGVVVGIPFTSVSRRTADSQFQSTETGLSDLLFGLKYAFSNDETAFALQVDGVLPMGYNRNRYETRLDPTTGEYLTNALGAGSQSVAGRILVGQTMPAWNGWIEGGAGYEATFGRAYVEENGGIVNEAKMLGAFVANAAAGVWFGNDLLIAGRYDGRMSMESIPDGAPGYGDDMQSVHLVGPLVTYRVDDHIDVTAGSLHTALGTRALHTDRFYVALTVKQSGLNRLQGFLGNKQQP